MTTLGDRFWSKVRMTSTCWIWTGASGGVPPHRYGKWWQDGRRVLAHRASYRFFVGEVPAGLDLDHLCRNTLCVNPAHLEAVTRRENILRGEGVAAKNAKKTHCPQGHPLSGDNLYEWNRQRFCRACHKKHSLAHSRRKAKR